MRGCQVGGTSLSVPGRLEVRGGSAPCRFQEKKVRHSARHDGPGRLDICASFLEWASLATKAAGASGGAGPHHPQVPAVKNSSWSEAREEETFYSGEHFANSETQPLVGTASVLSHLLESKGPPWFPDWSIFRQVRNSNCRHLDWLKLRVLWTLRIRSDGSVYMQMRT